MAEEAADPREVEWHPRRRHELVGHAEAVAGLLRTHASGRQHHAWLVTGPKGIGKATLAFAFARFLLAGAAKGQGLKVAENHPASRLIAAGSHPDLFVLQRAFDGKKVKSETSVDDARALSEFLSRTSGFGGWRVVVVDAADDLNSESANALLKLIEEPPEKAQFILVSHRPGVLLRTVRSRSVAVPLQPLDAAQTLQVVRGLPAASGAADAEIELAVSLAQGSPGRALELLSSKGAKTFAAFRAQPKLTPARCAELSAAFSGRDSGEDFRIFTELLLDWIGERARVAARAGGGAALARAHDEIVYSIRQMDALNLDRRQTALDALLALGEALKAA